MGKAGRREGKVGSIAILLNLHILLNVFCEIILLIICKSNKL